MTRSVVCLFCGVIFSTASVSWACPGADEDTSAAVDAATGKKSECGCQHKSGSCSHEKKAVKAAVAAESSDDSCPMHKRQHEKKSVAPTDGQKSD